MHLGAHRKKSFETDWFRTKVECWAEVVTLVATLENSMPQSVLEGNKKSLQNKWTFLKRVVPHEGSLLRPIRHLTTFSAASLEENNA